MASGREEAGQVSIEGVGQELRTQRLGQRERLDDKPVDDRKQQTGLGLGISDIRQVTFGRRSVEQPRERDSKLAVSGCGNLLQCCRSRRGCAEGQPDPSVPGSSLIEWQPEFQCLPKYAPGWAGQIDRGQLGVEKLDDVPERGRDELVLAAEVVLDLSQRDPGRRGDGAHRGAFESSLGNDLDHCLEYMRSPLSHTPTVALGIFLLAHQPADQPGRDRVDVVPAAGTGGELVEDQALDREVQHPDLLGAAG